MLSAHHETPNRQIYTGTGSITNSVGNGRPRVLPEAICGATLSDVPQSQWWEGGHFRIYLMMMVFNTSVVTVKSVDATTIRPGGGAAVTNGPGEAAIGGCQSITGAAEGIEI